VLVHSPPSLTFGLYLNERPGRAPSFAMPRRLPPGPFHLFLMPVEALGGCLAPFLAYCLNLLLGVACFSFSSSMMSAPVSELPSNHLLKKSPRARMT
jgi:hypothetical protein